MEVKELSKWLKKQVKFLSETEGYVGSYIKLDEYYCAVVLWEIEEEDNDENSQWGLVAGIKIYNPADTVDGWMYPVDKDENELLSFPTSVNLNTDFDSLATQLLKDYEDLEGTMPEENGHVSLNTPPKEIATTIDDETIEEDVEPTQMSNATKYWMEEAEFHASNYIDDPESYADDELYSILQHLEEQERKNLYKKVAEAFLNDNFIWEEISNSINQLMREYLAEFTDNTKNPIKTIDLEEKKKKIIKSRPLKEELKPVVTDWTEEVKYYLNNYYFEEYANYEGWLENNQDESDTRKEQIMLLFLIDKLPQETQDEIYHEMALEVVSNEYVINQDAVAEAVNDVVDDFLKKRIFDYIGRANIFTKTIGDDDKEEK